MNKFQNTQEFAEQMDAADPLAKFQQDFYFPTSSSKQKTLYFAGMSLGLQPKTVESAVQKELEKWANYGVRGHFHAAEAWSSYHELIAQPLAKLVGALPHEVIAMNTLTVNLHLMFATFYQPTNTRYKILMEADAFPSDRYAVETHLRVRGIDPETAIIKVEADRQNGLTSTQLILDLIKRHESEIAMVFWSGVSFRTGQLHDIATITQATHAIGAIAGFDLAHAVGNVPMQLHEQGVDFAIWCNYKYLNAGPGAVGACYIHEKHATDTNMPRLAGWWGHNKITRYAMPKIFDPIATIEGWQLSNSPILQMASLRASLTIFAEVGIQACRQKSEMLTAYLEFLLQQLISKITIVTPNEPNERGCQLSLQFDLNTSQLAEDLYEKYGIFCDARPPNIIRVAPTPLYNSFMDVYQFVKILQEHLT